MVPVLNWMCGGGEISLSAQIKRPHNQRRKADGGSQSESDQAIEKCQVGSLGRLVVRGVLPVDFGTSIVTHTSVTPPDPSARRASPARFRRSLLPALPP